MYKAFCSSPVGTLQITCSDYYVTSVLFCSGEEPDAATTAQPHPLLQRCIEQLNEYFEGKRKVFDLPVKQEGTPFQTKVWDRLVHIPYGKTISYLQLTKQLGDAKAIRAVAAANGKNNLVIVVPCHRVIGSNASLTGYAGGVWRKRWLLELEAKHEAGLQTLF